ncbi:MAG: hypothetical protein JKP96_00535 [Oceanicaulis sp.]|nr:hypothetical protein [Oceanicaulis sp.]
MLLYLENQIQTGFPVRNPAPRHREGRVFGHGSQDAHLFSSNQVSKDGHGHKKGEVEPFGMLLNAVNNALEKAADIGRNSRTNAGLARCKTAAPVWV